jgi:hypothetical protein
MKPKYTRNTFAEVLKLRDKGMSAVEISGALNIPSGTVGKYITPRFDAWLKAKAFGTATPPNPANKVGKRRRLAPKAPTSKADNQIIFQLFELLPTGSQNTIKQLILQEFASVLN